MQKLNNTDREVLVAISNDKCRWMDVSFSSSVKLLLGKYVMCHPEASSKGKRSYDDVVLTPKGEAEVAQFLAKRAAARLQQKARSRARHSAMSSLGMVRCRNGMYE